MNIFRTVDTALRGGYTPQADPTRASPRANTLALVQACLVLGLIYGAFMGLYGALRPTNASLLQLFASALKVPLLFLLTLVVSYPSLYVFSTLAGSRLRFSETLRLLLLGILVNLALLASLGPVTGFFTLSTESYPFMILLNVAFFVVSGLAGLLVTFRSLHRSLQRQYAQEEPLDWEEISAEKPSTDPASGESKAAESTPDDPSSSEESSSRSISTPPPLPSPPLRKTPARSSAADSRTRLIFTCWAFIYGVVGAQMGWILRPFVGTPAEEFQWFRHRESNFFEAIGRALRELLVG